MSYDGNYESMIMSEFVRKIVKKKKVKICNLKEGDLFEHKGVIYEVWIKRQWETMCRYVNEKAYTGLYGGYSDYLYCSFSNYTKVEV